MKYKIGQKIGELTLIKELPIHIQPSGKKKRKVIARCKCKNEFETNLYNITSGLVTTCRQCSNLRLGKKNTKHGLVKNKSKVYWIWSDIKKRCYNKNSKSYLRYGAKNIKMQKSWIDNVDLFYNYVSKLENFNEDNLGVGGITIDRINAFGDYAENNLRWVNSTIQNINKPLQKNNKTGFRGVSIRSNNNYQVSIRYKRKNNYLGTYNDIFEAVEKRNIFLKQIGIYDEYTKYE